MGGEADGEGELGLLALGTLEGGAAARAERPDGVELRRARHRHQAVGEGAVQVPARDLALVPVAEAAVAVSQRLVEVVAPCHVRFFSIRHLSFSPFLRFCLVLGKEDIVLNFDQESAGGKTASLN